MTTNNDEMIFYRIGINPCLMESKSYFEITDAEIFGRFVHFDVIKSENGLSRNIAKVDIKFLEYTGAV